METYRNSLRKNQLRNQKKHGGTELTEFLKAFLRVLRISVVKRLGF